jgi:hypothetical protein
MSSKEIADSMGQERQHQQVIMRDCNAISVEIGGALVYGTYGVISSSTNPGS